MWRDIEGFEQYEINAFGDVRRKDTGYILTPFMNKGHLVVCLAVGPKRKNVLVKKEVAKLFVDNPYNYRYVKFYDGDPMNCRADNLYWSEFPSKKASRQIYDLLTDETYDSVDAVAEATGLSKKSIYEAIKMMRWHHGHYFLYL